MKEAVFITVVGVGHLFQFQCSKLRFFFLVDQVLCLIGVETLLKAITDKHYSLWMDLNTSNNLKAIFQKLLKKCGIHKITIQNSKETSHSKKKNGIDEEKNKRHYQLLLHLDINELIPFSEKIGFRYCCHKSQRLEAGVTYKRFRNGVIRQRNLLTARVEELTDFTAINNRNF